MRLNNKDIIGQLKANGWFAVEVRNSIIDIIAVKGKQTIFLKEREICLTSIEHLNLKELQKKNKIKIYLYRYNELTTFFLNLKDIEKQRYECNFCGEIIDIIAENIDKPICGCGSKRYNFKLIPEIPPDKFIEVNKL